MAKLEEDYHDGGPYRSFETGLVVSCDPKNASCTVQRPEGGVLHNVPILGMFGGGGQSTDVTWTRKLRGCRVVLINVRGVYCVLATMPTTGVLSKAIV